MSVAKPNHLNTMDIFNCISHTTWKFQLNAVNFIHPCSLTSCSICANNELKNLTLNQLLD